MPQSPNALRKVELQAQLTEVELQLKELQKQFRDIKGRASESLSSAQKNADALELSALRKKLGLE